MKKVSIIVPVYNAEKTLIDCLSGLLYQTLSDIEIILVNDCSTDNSMQIMLDCEKQFPEKVIVVNLDVNRGAGGARNVGLMYATGEYIGFVDSDDMIVPEMYEKLYNKATEGNYDIVDSGFFNEEENNAIIYTSDELTGIQDGRKRRELIASGGYLWSKIFKKDFVDKIGLVFRENCILEDCETLMYAFALAKSIGNVKEILYNYRYYPQSLSRKLDYDKKYNNMIATMDAMENVLMILPNYDDIREAVEYAVVNFCVLCLQIIGEEDIERKLEIASYFKKLVKLSPEDNKYIQNKISKKDLFALNQCIGVFECKEIGSVLNKKIAFIVCVNDVDNYYETKRYLDNLIVPEGYETDVITIEGANSMCEGYNGGMQATEAKYKVYLHQDVRIINKNFIEDLLRIFEDKSVGLVGMVGTRKMTRNGYALSTWDTGKVYYNGDGFGTVGYNKPDAFYMEAEAVDGLLFATQYDVPFREDIFKEFDYYDISACYEYKRKGYKVVIACQQEPWTYHDSHEINMKNYEVNRHKFLNEYSKDFDFENDTYVIYDYTKDEIINEQISMLESIIDKNGMTFIAQEILNSQNYKRRMKDINLLAAICLYEKDRSVFRWDGNIGEMYNALNELKRFIKRIEYDQPMEKEEYGEFCNNYSLYSILNVILTYCMKKRKVLRKIYEYIPERNVINKFIAETTDNYSWKEDIINFGNVELYNKDKWNATTRTLLVIGDVESDDLFEQVLEEVDLQSTCVITKRSLDFITDLINKKIPVIIGNSICIKMYSAEMNWDVDKVYTAGSGLIVEETRRLYTNSHIVVKEII